MAKRAMGRGPKRSELGEGDFWALKDVSFEVRRGEVLGIIGANGAGKSTILKLLSRILRPNRGVLSVSGKLSSLIEIGAGFHPDLTGRENIYLNGTILGMKMDEIRSRFDEIVDFAGLEESIDTPVKRYSSGMYARLGFAVAAHVEPDVLLVDEVLSVGDIGFQKKCLGKMEKVAGHGRTVVFVSHNVSAVRQLCPRTLVVENGSITFDGESIQAVENYLGGMDRRSDYVATNPAGVRYISEARQEKNGNTPHGFVKRGNDLCVEIHFFNGDSAFEVALGISIETREMVRVIADFTLNSDQRMACRPGPNVYQVRIPQLPLNQGTYFVTVAVHDWDTGTVLDRQDQCLSFEIIDPGCDFGITRYTPRNGLVIWPCFWERM